MSNGSQSLAPPAGGPAPLRIPSIRISPERANVDTKLGFLAELAGTWEGEGFNLIARPDKEGGSPLFLELNQTFPAPSAVSRCTTLQTLLRRPLTSERPLEMCRLSRCQQRSSVFLCRM